MSKLYEIREMTFFAYEGSELCLEPGRDRLAEDHPLVVKNPDLFREVGENVVEQATQAPGEKRAVGRPRKAKADAEPQES